MKFRNAEQYFDPTAGKACQRIEEKERMKIYGHGRIHRRDGAHRIGWPKPRPGLTYQRVWMDGNSSASTGGLVV